MTLRPQNRYFLPIFLADSTDLFGRICPSILHASLGRIRDLAGFHLVNPFLYIGFECTWDIQLARIVEMIIHRTKHTYPGYREDTLGIDVLERPSLTRLIFYTIVVHTFTEKRKTSAIPLACYVTELVFSPWKIHAASDLLFQLVRQEFCLLLL
jgi:hypothetical protein